MKQIPLIFSHLFVFIGMFVMLLAGDLFAQSATNSGMGLGDGFVKTNGEYVTIGTAMFKTNSPENTDEFKHFMWRQQGDCNYMKTLVIAVILTAQVLCRCQAGTAILPDILVPKLTPLQAISFEDHLASTPSF